MAQNPITHCKKISFMLYVCHVKKPCDKMTFLSTLFGTIISILINNFFYDFLSGFCIMVNRGEEHEGHQLLFQRFGAYT